MAHKRTLNSRASMVVGYLSEALDGISQVMASGEQPDREGYTSGNLEKARVACERALREINEALKEART